MSSTVRQGKSTGDWKTTPMSWRGPGDRRAPEPRVPARGRHEAREDLEERRLPAAGRADHGDEVALADVEADALERRDVAVAGRVALREVSDGDRVHVADGRLASAGSRWPYWRWRDYTAPLRGILPPHVRRARGRGAGRAARQDAPPESLGHRRRPRRPGRPGRPRLLAGTRARYARPAGGVTRACRHARHGLPRRGADNTSLGAPRLPRLAFSSGFRRAGRRHRVVRGAGPGRGLALAELYRIILLAEDGQSEAAESVAKGWAPTDDGARRLAAWARSAYESEVRHRGKSSGRLSTRFAGSCPGTGSPTA